MSHSDPSCWIALHGGRGVAVVAADSDEEARVVAAEHGVAVDRVITVGDTRLRPGVRIGVAPGVHADGLTGVYPQG